MSTSTKIKGLFWRGGDVTPAMATGTHAARSPATVAASTAPASTIAGTDFTAVYAATDAAGDPRVDQLLAAFEGMRTAMPAAQLAVAIAATGKAIGVDSAVVGDTLGKRLQALEAAVTDEQRRVTERRAQRATELASTTAKVEAEVAAMKQRIAAFEQQLAAAARRVQEQDANEHGLVAAFEQRARAEAARLGELRDFLGSTAKRR